MEIRSLTPDLAEDYLRLFDHAFADNPRWAGCFCAFYDDPCSDEDWDTEAAGFAERNRANRHATIERGEAGGLLAYRDGEPVGWLNAMPRSAYGNLRVFEDAVEEGDPEVGSLMCFVIHPDHRGQGVATSLLAAADDHFRAMGVEVAEAYPRAAEPPEGFPWTAAFYKGTPAMFAAAGYAVHREGERFTVMRKVL